MGLLSDVLPLWDLTHVPQRPLGCQDLSLSTTHVVPVASALRRALSPAWSGDGLRDGTWMPLGVTFELRNNGCALFVLPSPPLPDPLSQPEPILALFLVTYHMFCGQAGEGEGSSSGIAYSVPAPGPSHCPFSGPLGPADGILIGRGRSLTAASVPQAVSVSDRI